MPTERTKGTALLALSVAFLTAVSLSVLFPGEDPYRCRALIRTGRWADPPDREGNREPFGKWQPDGCIMKTFDKDDIQTCMQNRSMVFGGDSTSRYPLWAAARMLTFEEQVQSDSMSVDQGASFSTTYDGVGISKDWNIFLDIGNDNKTDPFMADLNLYRKEKKMGFELPVPEQKGPAIFYLAAGAWFTLDKYFPGLDHHARSRLYEEALLNVSEALGPNKGMRFYQEPLDPVDGVGNQLFYVPPHGPRDASTTSARQTQEMREIVAEREDDLNMPVAWAIPKMVEGQPKSWKGDKSGFHVREALHRARANLVLNARCNARLDRLRKHNHGTCCTDYGRKTVVQLVTVSLAVVWLALCTVSSAKQVLTPSDQPEPVLLSTRVIAFPLVLLMSYFADRTQMMAKGERIYTAGTFVLFVVVILIVALGTIRPVRRWENEHQLISEHPPQAEPNTDAGLRLSAEEDGILSDSVLQEWRGFITLLLLAYHWSSAASEQSLLVIAHICVGSYLFQMSYEKTLLYLTKGDFSFQHVASTLLRLNLLAWALTFIMDTDYLAYLLSPLISVWYVVVHATMAVGQRYNGDPRRLVAKIVGAGILISGILSYTPLIFWSHISAKALFNVQFSADAWVRHVTQDMYIVYVGMLVAAVSRYAAPSTIISAHRISWAVGSAALSFLYLLQSSRTDEAGYLKYHAALSFLPVLGYLVLRNISGAVKHYHSYAMAWVGRCFLETSNLQAHLFLASTGQGVLLVDGLSGGDATLLGRLGSLVITVPIFLWVSSAASEATKQLADTLLGHPAPCAEKQLETSNVLMRIVKMPTVRVGMLCAVLWGMNLASPLPQTAPQFD